MTKKEIVIARLEVLPKDKKISIGIKGTFTKDELITHVQRDDSIGKKITEIEIGFLRAIKDDIFKCLR